jgi:hypothetical protein
MNPFQSTLEFVLVLLVSFLALIGVVILMRMLYKTHR